MSVMTQIAEAVAEIDGALAVVDDCCYFGDVDGSIFAAVSLVDILLKWRNWSTKPDRLETSAECRFTGCLKSLCDNSLVEYGGMFFESEDGVLKRC